MRSLSYVSWQNFSNFLTAVLTLSFVFRACDFLYPNGREIFEKFHMIEEYLLYLSNLNLSTNVQAKVITWYKQINVYLW